MTEMQTSDKDIADLLGEILVKNDFSKDAKITYEPSGDEADYSSKNLGVSVVDADKSLDLFIKYVHGYQANEIYFYEVIYPGYQKVLKEVGVENGLKGVPRCYGTSKNKIIALENLKKKGYHPCDKTNLLENDHIILALKSFAEIHAVSFAMKDHDRETFDQLLGPISISQNKLRDRKIGQIIRDDIERFLESLDPIKHRRLLQCFKNLSEELVEYVGNTLSNADTNEYDILIQGDCRCKNMMFLYEGSNKANPQAMVLVDWQKIKPGIPVIDLSYFFYSVAPKEALDNLEDYLRIYHCELSEHLRRLGSKPGIVYPFPVLKQQWKQHGKFGYYMAFLLTRAMIYEEGNGKGFVRFDLEKVAESTKTFDDVRKDEEQYKRLIMLTEHMVDNEFI